MAWNAPDTRDRTLGGMTTAKIAAMLMSSTITPNPLVNSAANSMSEHRGAVHAGGERHQRERRGEHQAARHVHQPGAEPGGQPLAQHGAEHPAERARPDDHAEHARAAPPGRAPRRA